MQIFKNNHKGFLACLLTLLFLSHPLAIAKPPTPVTTEKLENLLFYPQHQVAASILSLNQAQVKAETQGRVIALPRKVGDVVNQGDVLAVLDCRDQDYSLEQHIAAIEGTQARLELLQWQVKQSKQLADQKNASLERVKTLESELKLTQAQLRSQNSQVEYAKHQISRCKIKAPYQGVITKRFIHLGEYTHLGTPVVELVANQDVEVQALFHPEEVRKLSKVNTLHFETRDNVYPIKVRQLVQALNENDHTQEIRFTFTEKTPLPGTLGKVTWQDPWPHLPSELLLQRGQHYGLFIKNHDQAQFIPIEGAREGQPIPLPHGFKQEVIVQGRQQLEDGFDLLTVQENA